MSTGILRTILPLAAAAPSHAAKKMEVALQDDGVFLYEEHYDRDLAYRQLRALGGTHLRMNILWWQPIPAAQARMGTGILTVAYPGDPDAVGRRSGLPTSSPPGADAR